MPDLSSATYRNNSITIKAIFVSITSNGPMVSAICCGEGIATYDVIKSYVVINMDSLQNFIGKGSRTVVTNLFISNWCT